MEKFFMIFNVSEINKIDYSQVLTTSPETSELIGGTTLKFSVDGSKTFVKWGGNQIPSFLDDFTTKEGPYTYQQMLEIINSSEWKKTYNDLIT